MKVVLTFLAPGQTRMKVDESLYKFSRLSSPWSNENEIPRKSNLLSSTVNHPQRKFQNHETLNLIKI